jgi:hypothetical protein
MDWPAAGTASRYFHADGDFKPGFIISQPAPARKRQQNPGQQADPDVFVHNGHPFCARVDRRIFEFTSAEQFVGVIEDLP